MEIKTRRQAAQAGENKYYTGRPCSKGHDGPRYTATGACCKCNSEGVKAYNKRMSIERVSRNIGVFAYQLHPDDHAAALAFCQALDLQRGRVPSTPNLNPEALKAREFSLPEDLARHRARVVTEYGPKETPAPYLPKP